MKKPVKFEYKLLLLILLFLGVIYLSRIANYCAGHDCEAEEVVKIFITIFYMLFVVAIVVGVYSKQKESGINGFTDWFLLASSVILAASTFFAFFYNNYLPVLLRKILYFLKMDVTTNLDFILSIWLGLFIVCLFLLSVGIALYKGSKYKSIGKVFAVTALLIIFYPFIDRSIDHWMYDCNLDEYSKENSCIINRALKKNNIL